MHDTTITSPPPLPSFSLSPRKQCIDAWLDLHHECPQCRLDLLTHDIDWGNIDVELGNLDMGLENRPDSPTSEHPAMISPSFSPYGSGPVPLPVSSEPLVPTTTLADDTTTGVPPDARRYLPSPPRLTDETQTQVSRRYWQDVDRVAIANAKATAAAAAAAATKTMDTTKTPASAAKSAVTAPHEGGSGVAHHPHLSGETKPTEIHPASMAECLTDAPKQPVATSHAEPFSSAPVATYPLSAAATANGQLLPEPEAAATCSTTSPRLRKDAPDFPDADCDSFTDVTEYNTAVNATPSARWTKPAAPYASMFQFIGSPESGEMQWADGVEARTAQPQVTPHASYIDSICSFSPSPRDAVIKLQNSSPEGAPYAGNFMWPGSPQPSLSDSDMDSLEHGERSAWRAGMVGIEVAQPRVAPYARYLDSPSPTRETAMVQTRGASNTSAAAAYGFSSSPCSSPSLSGAGGVVNFRLSPEFVRVARSRVGGGSGAALAGIGGPGFTMFSPPVRSYPLTRQVSREIDGTSTAGSRAAVVGTRRQRQRGRRGRAGLSERQVQSQDGFTFQALDEGAAPPPPPPRLGSGQLVAVKQSRRGGRPPPAAKPRASSVANSYNHGSGGKINGGNGRGVGAPPRSSPGLLVLGNANPAVEEEVGTGWERPLRASTWGKNAWPANGGGVHIESLNEEGEGGRRGEERAGGSQTDVR